MLPKERVLAVFEHRPTDQIPIYMASLSSKIASEAIGREAYVGGGVQRWREATALWNGEEAHREFLERTYRDTLDLVRALDLDYVRPSYWRKPEKPAEKIDDYTFKYVKKDGSWEVLRYDPDAELFTEVDWGPRRELEFEDLERQLEKMEASLDSYDPMPDELEAMQNALAEYGEERAVRGGGVGVAIPREPIWLEATILRPDLVERYLDLQVERAYRNIAAQEPLGVRFLRGGGDFAGDTGPMYSPKVFHELMLPRLQKVSEACHAKGMFHMFGSDGDLWPVADDLFGRSGVDALYEMDIRCKMIPEKLRTRFPDITLLGGISSQTLHLGEKADVVAETERALATAKAHGSMIVGPSNLVVSKTPSENFWAMVETLHAQR